MGQFPAAHRALDFLLGRLLLQPSKTIEVFLPGELSGFVQRLVKVQEKCWHFGCNGLTFQFVKTDEISVRGCPPQVKQNLKTKAKANHRSLNAEVLRLLEREAEEPPPVKGHELACRLRAARKLMTEQEHREFGRDIERGIDLMRSRERPPEP